MVELDLPKSYEAAAETLAEWRASGALVQEDEPAMWALRQDYTAPDGTTARAPASSRACAWRTTGRAGSGRTSAPTPAPRRTG